MILTQLADSLGSAGSCHDCGGFRNLFRLMPRNGYDVVLCRSSTPGETGMSSEAQIFTGDSARKDCMLARVKDQRAVWTFKGGWAIADTQKQLNDAMEVKRLTKDEMQKAMEQAFADVCEEGGE